MRSDKLKFVGHELRLPDLCQMFNLDNVTIRPEPFTVFCFRNVLQPAFYRQLADSFPPISLFSFRTNLGNKYLLTESEGDAYYDFIKSSPPWRKFYEAVKSNDFKTRLLGFLNSHDVGGATQPGAPASGNDFTVHFEFSALPTNGGSQRPHTDNPEKVVTLVLSLMKEGEWSPDWRGGTSICKPKDESRYLNYANKYLDFDEVEIVDDLPFAPNAGVMFVKTSVSWHCVTPINLPPAAPARKTVAISLYHEAGAQPAADWSGS